MTNRKKTIRDAGAIGLLIFIVTSLSQIYNLPGVDEATKYFLIIGVFLVAMFAYFQFYKT